MKKVLAVLLAAALFLAYAAVFAEEAAPEAEEPQIFAWADQGNVQLTMVGDCPEEMMSTFMAKPSGRLIMVELTILDGAKMDSGIALDFAKENVKLDDFEYWNIVAPGVEIVETEDGGFSAALVGTIDVFFDVPEDYDLDQAVLVICGVEAFIPAPAETAAE